MSTWSHCNTMSKHLRSQNIDRDSRHLNEMADLNLKKRSIKKEDYVTFFIRKC